MFIQNNAISINTKTNTNKTLDICANIHLNVNMDIKGALTLEYKTKRGWGSFARERGGESGERERGGEEAHSVIVGC